jgi:hypothetical protein
LPGTIFFSRRDTDRSMISASAMIEASSSGQMGQPAAWMIANNSVPLAFPRRPPLAAAASGVLVLVRRL